MGGDKLNRAAVAVEDTLDDRQSQAGAGLLRGEKGGEQVIHHFRRDTGSVVADLDPHPGLPLSKGSQLDAPVGLALERIEGVDHQVDQDLFQGAVVTQCE